MYPSRGRIRQYSKLLGSRVVSTYFNIVRRRRKWERASSAYATHGVVYRNFIEHKSAPVKIATTKADGTAPKAIRVSQVSFVCHLLAHRVRVGVCVRTRTSASEHIQIIIKNTAMVVGNNILTIFVFIESATNRWLSSCVSAFLNELYA